MDYKNWDLDWKKEQYIPVFVEEISESKATYALREAWNNIYGSYPSDDSLALLWAQSALETGRWKVIRNNNFGNIKKRHYKKLSWTVIPDDNHNWTMFATGENIWNSKLEKTEWHWFEPPHYQTHFRSYEDITKGAEDYIKFISRKERYKKAWQEVINGNPIAFSKELRAAGYYTASEKKYTNGIIRLVEEFKKRKNELLSYKPDPVMLKEVIIEGDVPSSAPANEKPTIKEGLIEKKKPVAINKKTSIMIVIAALITGAYAWFKNFF